MDHKHIVRPFLKCGYPGDKPVPVRMAADTLHGLSMGPHINFLAKYLHGLSPVLKNPPQGSLCLVSREHNGTLRPPQIMFQVVAYTARVTHACR